MGESWRKDYKALMRHVCIQLALKKTAAVADSSHDLYSRCIAKKPCDDTAAHGAAALALLLSVLVSA